MILASILAAVTLLVATGAWLAVRGAQMRAAEAEAQRDAALEAARLWKMQADLNAAAAEASEALSARVGQIDTALRQLDAIELPAPIVTVVHRPGPDGATREAEIIDWSNVVAAHRERVKRLRSIAGPRPDADPGPDGSGVRA